MSDKEFFTFNPAEAVQSEYCESYFIFKSLFLICCLEYMQPDQKKAKRPGVSSGHDDLVNADEAACRHFWNRRKVS